MEEIGIEAGMLDMIQEHIEALNEANEDRTHVEYDTDIISEVLIDLFWLNAHNLKVMADFCMEQGLQIGRRHKAILNRYLNYREQADWELFIHELGQENEGVDAPILLERVNRVPRITSQEAVEIFRLLWAQANMANDESKLSDYLFGIYSRLHARNNSVAMSNKDLFKYNEGFIGQDLSEASVEALREFCEANDGEETFYQRYVSLLRRELQAQSLAGQLEPSMNQTQEAPELVEAEAIRDRKGDLHYLLTEEYDAVYLRVNQAVFDTFDTEQDFYNYVLDAIEQAFRILVNNKVFAVEIDNIYLGNRNLKWLLYAYIGVYAERFIRTQEKRKYFAPNLIAKEMLEAYGIRYQADAEKAIAYGLKRYYSAKTEEAALKVEEDLFGLVTGMNREEFHAYLEEWKFVYYGFTFNDCLVLRGALDPHAQYAGIVQNDNKLLYIFYKYRMDERKTPCPVCNGLDVAGNSYPEVGHRSWECKNVICKSRSKSNRGKRYSFKSNYMQAGMLNLSHDNIIPRVMIAQWRKDIALIQTDEEIYRMFIKYFSFPGERVLFINGNEQFIPQVRDLNRRITNISCLENFEGLTVERAKVAINPSLFRDYFEEGRYLDRFFRDKVNGARDNSIGTALERNADAFVINGDSFEILHSMPQQSVAAAVTSPPYFNAREYSQWKNMYLYYIDMYNIAKNVLPTLVQGGHIPLQHW